MIIRAFKRLHSLQHLRSTGLFSTFDDFKNNKNKGRVPFFSKNKDKTQQKDDKQTKSNEPIKENPFKPRKFNRTQEAIQEKSRETLKPKEQIGIIPKVELKKKQKLPIFEEAKVQEVKQQLKSKKEYPPRKKGIIIEDVDDQNTQQINLFEEFTEEVEQEIEIEFNDEEFYKKFTEDFDKILSLYDSKQWSELRSLIETLKPLSNEQEIAKQLYHVFTNRCPTKYIEWLAAQKTNILALSDEYLKNILNQLIHNNNFKEAIKLAKILAIEKPINISYSFLDNIFLEIDKKSSIKELKQSLPIRYETVSTLLQLLWAYQSDLKDTDTNSNLKIIGDWIHTIWYLAKQRKLYPQEFICLFQKLVIRHGNRLSLIELRSSGLFLDILQNYYFGSHITTQKLTKLFSSVILASDNATFIQKLRDSMRLYKIRHHKTPFPNAKKVYQQFEQAISKQKYEFALFYYVLCVYSDDKNPFLYFNDHKNILSVFRHEQIEDCINDGLLNLSSKQLLSSPKNAKGAHKNQENGGSTQTEDIFNFDTDEQNSEYSQGFTKEDQFLYPLVMQQAQADVNMKMTIITKNIATGQIKVTTNEQIQQAENQYLKDVDIYETEGDGTAENDHETYFSGFKPIEAQEELQVDEEIQDELQDSQGIPNQVQQSNLQYAPILGDHETDPQLIAQPLIIFSEQELNQTEDLNMFEAVEQISALMEFDTTEDEDMQNRYQKGDQEYDSEEQYNEEMSERSKRQQKVIEQEEQQEQENENQDLQENEVGHEDNKLNEMRDDDEMPFLDQELQAYPKEKREQESSTDDIQLKNNFEQSSSESMVEQLAYLHRKQLRMQAQQEKNYNRKQLYRLIINTKSSVQAVKAAIKLGKLELAYTLFRQATMHDQIIQRTKKNIDYAVRAFLREHDKVNKEGDIHQIADSLHLIDLDCIDQDQQVRFIESIYEKTQNFDHLIWTDLPEGDTKFKFWESTMILDRAKELIKMDITGKLDQMAYEPEYYQTHKSDVKQFYPGGMSWRDELVNSLGIKEHDATPVDEDEGLVFEVDSLEDVREHILTPLMTGDVSNFSKYGRVYFGKYDPKIEKMMERSGFDQFFQEKYVQFAPIPEQGQGEQIQGEQGEQEQVEGSQQTGEGQQVQTQIEGTEQKEALIQEELLPIEQEGQEQEQTSESKQTTSTTSQKQQTSGSAERLDGIFEHSQKMKIKGYDYNAFIKTTKEVFRPMFQRQYESDKDFIKLMLALQAIAEDARFVNNHDLQNKLNLAQQGVTNPIVISKLFEHGLWNFDFVTVSHPHEYLKRSEMFRELFFEYKKYLGLKIPGVSPDLSKRYVQNFSDVVISRRITMQLVEELLLNRQELFLQAQAVVKLQPCWQAEQLMAWGVQNQQPLAIYLGQKLAMLNNQKISHPLAVSVGHYLSHRRPIPQSRIQKCKQALKIVGRINREHIYEFNQDYEHITIRKHSRKYLHQKAEELNSTAIEHIVQLDPTHKYQDHTINLKHNLTRGNLIV